MPSRENLERWLQVIELISYYDILGVPQHATDTAIRDAFHRFGAAFHPDRHREDEGIHSKVTRVFRRGVEAYRVLRHPALRARYDLGLAQGRLRLESDEREPAWEVHSLRALCMTPAGRLYAGHAEQHLERRDLRAALAALDKAHAAEGKNPSLAERLEALRELMTLNLS